MVEMVMCYEDMGDMLFVQGFVECGDMVVLDWIWIDYGDIICVDDIDVGVGIGEWVWILCDDLLDEW